LQHVVTTAVPGNVAPGDRILCHCNTLSVGAVLAAVDALRVERPHDLVTPGLVYRKLGTRGRCCGCFPSVVALIHSQYAGGEDVEHACRDDRSDCSDLCRRLSES
jgi:hypothetical protein